ncbi:MAG: TolC family protein [Mucinivorans sp.]
MKKQILTLLFLLTLGGQVWGQNYSEFMGRVVAQSAQIHALRATLSADSLGLRRGLNPLDPSLSVDYFMDGEQSFEFKVEQNFDFPTLYHQRNKLSRLSVERSQAQFRADRFALLTTASDRYIAMAWAQRQVALLQGRADELEQMLALSTKSLSGGNTTALEQSKIEMLLRECKVSLVGQLSELSQAYKALRQLGYPIDSSRIEVPTFTFSGSAQEFVQVAMACNNELEALRVDSLVGVHRTRLARQEWIPQVVLGYRLNRDQGALRHGLVAGITLPLWGNRNNVRQAKALSVASQATRQSREQQIQMSLENLYQAYQSAQQSLAQIDKMDIENYDQLLNKSFRAGQINAIDFLRERGDVFAMQQQRLSLGGALSQIEAMMALLLWQ